MWKQKRDRVWTQQLSEESWACIASILGSLQAASAAGEEEGHVSSYLSTRFGFLQVGLGIWEQSGK